MDRLAGVGGEIAPAVEDEPLPGRGDREEGSRDLLVVQSGAPDAQIVLQVARRGVAGLVLAGVDGQQRAPIGTAEALSNSLLRLSVRDREDAGGIFDCRSELRNQERLRRKGRTA
jgi:hypothetical protein